MLGNTGIFSMLSASLWCLSCPESIRSSPAMTKETFRYRRGSCLLRVRCGGRDLRQDLVAQPLDQLFNDLLVRRGKARGGLGCRCRAGLLLGILDQVEQYLFGTQTAGCGFVDRLGVDGLGHGVFGP